MDNAGLFENTGRASGGPQHPSIFELLAQDQLRDLLQPAVRYVLNFLTQRYPRYLLRVLNNHEEFYALLSLVLEGYHLRRHNASLSEHFYNLRYVSASRIPTPRLAALNNSAPQVPPNISRKQRYGLLMVLVGIPYIRARAQDCFERLGGGIDAEAIPLEDDGQAVQLAETHSTIRRRARSAFKLAYPYANLAWELYLLGYDVGYMFDRTPRWRPWFTLFGVKLERVQPPPPPSPNAKRSLASYLPPLLPPLLLLLKFSQWYYSPTSPFSILAASKKPDASSMHSRIAPPPPLPIIKTDGERAWPYGTCPVCENAWQNPTALPTGWVMCWRCAWEAIDETGTCPVTGAGVHKDDLRRVLV